MTTAQEMALLAAGAYDAAFGDDYEILYSGGVSNSQFHILQDAFKVIVVITGSNELADWFSNILVRRRKNVHRGFLRDFEEITPVLEREVAKSPRERLVCTGHSYGSALASLAALHFAEQYAFDNIELHTFGAPRVGNREWCAKLNAYVPFHTRHANRFDIVTKVPFGFGYRHAGHAKKYKSGRHAMSDYIRNVGLTPNKEATP